MTTLLGFDFGPRKIGVAVGQMITRSATPLTTLRSRNDRPDWEQIQRLIQDWKPSALILGLPYNMDDTEVDWSPRVHRFARQLQGRFGLPVHLVDERLTSIEAHRQLSARPGRKPPTREAVDAAAAALILETWLCEQD
ncbi:Holliday junction resolvase RuvX [Thiorhodococcus mannitoliphagus]|uniref:Putative pre-16S rRNA nuclease n=1 Tax=Thiorhodococcus mannitoliphagus TaxID=329406 RepID=A0A6P1DZ31_9GAMM|nr:Holliday junction resolvase RuvX [Thiorhodococcus mannitoliphagus]NEX22281.1 Holliday junction resolvase RuvX [Thiorhodococcus mannitoliphagus]